MHILFIGGTQFVGRAIAEAALERNHKITLLHRNPTNDPAFADVEHVLLDRNGDLWFTDHGVRLERSSDRTGVHYIPPDGEPWMSQ